jgi:ProP effector
MTTAELPSSPRALLKDLSANYAVFRDYQPLAVGIKKQVAERYPGLPSKLLGVALFLHTGSPRYLKSLVVGAARLDLDGNAAGEVTEEHQQHAVEQLKEILRKQAEARRAEAKSKREEEAAKKAEEQRSAKLQQLAAKFSKR